MSADVAVTATAFMDLTFVGLESIPELGEERFAGALMRSPGGGAINAIGAARLGLRTALASPLGEDIEGRHIARALEEEGISVLTREGARTATTAVMPWGGERAMVTFDPGLAAQAEDVARFDPRAVIVGLHQLDLRAGGRHGLRDLRRRRRPPVRAEHPAGPRRRALPCSSTPARGSCSRGRARRRTSPATLGERVEVAVVTLGPEGALAQVNGGLVRAPGFDMEPVDTTGAGDLLCSAFVWAELRGADVETALRWAVLYASLSVTVPTGRGRRRDAGAAARGGLAARVAGVRRRDSRPQPHFRVRLPVCSPLREY